VRVLNWEKCHFMVQERIVLSHQISANDIEVDRAKVDIIEKLPPSTNVKGVRMMCNVDACMKISNKTLNHASPTLNGC